MTQLSGGSIVCSSYGWALLPTETAEKMKDTLTHSPFSFLGGYILRSDDGGNYWKGPFVPMNTPGDKTLDALGRPIPAYNRGAMLQARDGHLYWAVAANVEPKNRQSSVHLLRSLDRGETWQYICPIARDEKVQFNETSLVQTQKGDILAFMRTDKFEGKLAFARSIDGGKSFQPWKDSGFYGYPSHALRLPDGKIFLVYGYRQKPFGIRARLLQPDASDIGQAEEFILREDGGTGDIGYPWSALLSDGRILVAYYFNKENGTRYIAGSILKVKR
jgi:sialidase-1